MTIVVGKVEGMSTNINHWTKQDVIDWLFDQQFAISVIDFFQEQIIDGRQLLLLQESDLDPHLKLGERKLLIYLRDQFAERNLFDIDGKICERAKWYWRALSALFSMVFFILFSNALKYSSIPLFENKENSYIGMILFDLIVLMISPSQDISYHVTGLYLIDQDGNYAGFIVGLSRYLISIGFGLFLYYPSLNVLFAVMNVITWVIAGDLVPDLFLSSSVCSFV